MLNSVVTSFNFCFCVLLAWLKYFGVLLDVLSDVCHGFPTLLQEDA
jgi:hypothetical protein